MSLEEIAARKSTSEAIEKAALRNYTMIASTIPVEPASWHINEHFQLCRDAMFQRKLDADRVRKVLSSCTPLQEIKFDQLTENMSFCRSQLQLQKGQRIAQNILCFLGREAISYVISEEALENSNKYYSFDINRFIASTAEGCGKSVVWLYNSEGVALGNLLEFSNMCVGCKFVGNSMGNQNAMIDDVVYAFPDCELIRLSSTSPFAVNASEVHLAFPHLFTLRGLANIQSLGKCFLVGRLRVRQDLRCNIDAVKSHAVAANILAVLYGAPFPPEAGPSNARCALPLTDVIPLQLTLQTLFQKVLLPYINAHYASGGSPLHDYELAMQTGWMHFSILGHISSFLRFYGNRQNLFFVGEYVLPLDPKIFEQRVVIPVKKRMSQAPHHTPHRPSGRTTRIDIVEAMDVAFPGWADAEFFALQLASYARRFPELCDVEAVAPGKGNYWLWV